jgi:PAS domain S-box-containing protein
LAWQLQQEQNAVTVRPVVIFRSIKTKVTLIITGAVVVLLVLVSGLEMYRVQSNLGKVLGDQQLTLVSRVADEIDEKLRAVHGALTAVSGVMLPIARDPERLRDDLARRPGLQSLFDGMFVFTGDGTVIVDLPAIGALGQSAADREYFQDTLKHRRGVISRPYLGRVLKEPVIMLTAPVLDEKGEPVAILGGALNLLRPNFLGKLATASVGKTGQFALFGRDRTIIISRDRERIMTPGPRPGVSPYFDRAVSGAEGWEESVNSRGLHALFSYSQLETVPWVLVAALPVDEAYAPIVEARRYIAGFTIALIVILAPLVWFGTTRFMAPLIALHDEVRRIRDDPSKVAAVPVQSNDEIGDLAADFNALMRERNDAAAALKDSGHRLSMIADNTPALISYVDANERYRYANATYSQWFAEPATGIPGKSVRELMGEADYAAREAYIRQALAGKEVSFETPLMAGGVLRHLHVRYVPDVRDDGTVVGFFILANDIGELKRAEALLRNSERQLSLALEGSQLALFDWNMRTGEVFLSHQWSAMMGGAPEPMHTTFTELEARVHADDRDLVGRSIRDALKGATTHYRVEHRVRTDDGRWIWIQSHGQVTERNEAGRALRLVGTNADIAERKRNEEELAASRMELERVALIDSLTGLPNRREFD